MPFVTPVSAPRLAALLFAGLGLALPAFAQRAMEQLGRGVVAVRTSPTEVFVGWRLLGTDPDTTAFNLYRAGNDGPPARLNPAPLTRATWFTDPAADAARAHTYFVRPLFDGATEGPPAAGFTLPAHAPVRPYLSLPLEPPPGGTTPAGEAYTYSPNDCSTGDLDGDGEYELVVKWEPSNAKDNSQSGYTGPVWLEGLRLDGTRLWRINLGVNIRAGAHYTQFLVYDLDGDGRAELACKTAPGTIDGRGRPVLLPGDDAAADYRNASGYVLTGPEYLTVFDGRTGAALATTPYVPPRGSVGAWGDTYGNRVDRFLAAVAYLDGRRPSLVMCRGYYTRAVLAAWDWRDGRLTSRWVFDSDDGTPGHSRYRGEGNHNLSVADVDGDGRDEIIYGSCVIAPDGRGLYASGLRHGDALHVSDLDPDRPGLEVWACHEDANGNGGIGLSLRDARTGEVLFAVRNTTEHRLPTLMHDPQYRLAVAWQNVAYNQPPHPGFFLGDGMTRAPTPFIRAGERPGRLANFSVRAPVRAADGPLIAGFAIAGTGTQAALVRGVGPTLAAFGVADPLPNPRLELYADRTRLAASDDWSAEALADAIAARAVALGAFPLARPGRDAALLRSFPPGGYTAHLLASDASRGVGLFECYADDAGPARLANLSVRALTAPGADTLVAGFVVEAATARTILVRVVGPGLEGFGVAGVLRDPVLTVFRGGTVVATNDDWQRDGGATAATFAAAGAFPLPAGSKDAALLLHLPAGACSVHAGSADGASGIVLIELYDLGG